ncbi:MAG: hypothetical protein EA426_16745 [Spirochaetaceae bacterium]|nr:MAG: hypothetical protein EA426_16745 [Spirochaetaceae bacterium]
MRNGKSKERTLNLGRVVKIVVIVAVVVVLAGCLPGHSRYTTERPAGFFWGVWHGWVAPVSLIAGLFVENVRLYETTNTGWWYDFGFYIAIISGFGGLSLFRHKRDH